MNRFRFIFLVWCGIILASPTLRSSTTWVTDYGFSPQFESLKSRVMALGRQSDGKIIVGGDFDRFNHTDVGNLLRVDATGQVDPTFTPPSFNSHISEIVVLPDDSILISGNFSLVNGAGSVGLIKLGVDGARDESFVPPAIQGHIKAIVPQPDGRILVGGALFIYGQPDIRNLVRLESNGTLDQNFLTAAVPDGDVNALQLMANGTLYVGGAFTSMGDLNHSRLARLTPEGTVDETFRYESDRAVLAFLVRTNGDILVTGIAASIGRPMVHTLSPSGEFRPTTIPATNTVGLVNLFIEASDGRVFAGGAFDEGNSGRLNGLMEIDELGGRKGSFQVAHPSSRNVRAMILHDNELIWGADELVNTRYPDAIVMARVNLEGTEDVESRITATKSGLVTSFAQTADGGVVAVGTFDTVNGIAMPRIARLTALGELDPTFNNRWTSGVLAEVQACGDGTFILLGSSFTYSGNLKLGLARISASGEFLNTFSSIDGSNGFQAMAIDLEKKQVVTAPSVTNGGNNIVRRFSFDGTETNDVTVDRSWLDSVSRILIDDSGNTVVAGRFTFSGSGAPRAFARLTVTGEIDSEFNALNEFYQVTGNVVAAPSGGYYVGGNGLLVRANLGSTGQAVRVDASGTIDATFQPGAAAQLSLVQAFAPLPEGQILMGGTPLVNSAFDEGMFIVDATGAIDETAGLAEISASRLTAAATAPTNTRVWLAGSEFSIPGTNQRGMMRLVDSSYSNDEYEYAQIIDSAFGETTIDNRGASVDDDKPPLTGGSGKSVWYHFKPQSTAVTRIDVLGLPSGEQAALILLGEDGVTPLEIESVGGDGYRWPVVSGQSYWLGVDTSNTGQVFQMNWRTLNRPEVTLPTSSTLKRVGDSISFYPTVTGADVTYQWRRNGYPIPGAVSSDFSIPSLSLLNDGFYDLVVSNGAGEAVTEKQRIIVRPRTLPRASELDPDWGAILEVNGGALAAVAATSEGGFVVAGYFTQINSHPTRSVAKYTSEGLVDTTFTSTLQIDGDIFDVRQMADGNIVVAGNLAIDGVPATLVRLRANGTHDLTFANPQFFSQYCYRIGTDAIGRIYGIGTLASDRYDTPLKLFRFLPDGSWDSSYQPDFPASSFYATALSVAADGQVFVGVKFTDSNTGNQVAHVVKVTPDGLVESKPWRRLDGLVEVGELMLDEAGNLLIIGLPEARDQMAWRRFHAAGSLDRFFSGGGGAPSSAVRAVAVADGGFLFTNGLAVFRVDATGTLLATPIARSKNAVMQGLAVDTRGGVVMVAGSWNGQQIKGDLSRVDATYASDNLVSASMLRGANAHDLVIEPDGSVVLVGDFEWVNGVTRPRIAKLNPDGSVAPAFKNSPMSGTARLLRRLPNGSFLASGDFFAVGGHFRNGLVRFLADGTVDTSFAPPENWNNFGDFSTTAMLLPLSDGRVLVGGRFSAPGSSNPQLKLYRLNNDGSVDPTFAPLLARGLRNIAGAVEMANGDILVGGDPFDEADGRNVVRIKPDGTRDTTYLAESAELMNINGMALSWTEDLWVLGNPTIDRLGANGVSELPASDRPYLSGGGTLFDSDYDLYPQSDGSLFIMGGGSVHDRSGEISRFAAHLYANGVVNPSFKIAGLNRKITASAMSDSAEFVIATEGDIRRTREVQPPRHSSGAEFQLEQVGNVVVLEAKIQGSFLEYQWFKNGTALPGATLPWLIISEFSAADQALYTVRASNAKGATWGKTTRLELAESANGIVGSQRIQAVDRTDGLPVAHQITNRFTLIGDATEVRWHALLPEGWRLFDQQTSGTTASPADGTTEVATWTWASLANTSIEFSYRLEPVDSPTPNPQLVSMLEVDTASGKIKGLVRPDPLPLRRGFFHDADLDGNRQISLSELLRVIELYNGRAGSFRTGGYKTDSAQTDGFTADALIGSDPIFTYDLEHYHSADSDRNAQISLGELLRVIELYNTRSGSTRTGTYSPQSDTADGFAPGSLD